MQKIKIDELPFVVPEEFKADHVMPHFNRGVKVYGKPTKILRLGDYLVKENGVVSGLFARDVVEADGNVERNDGETKESKELPQGTVSTSEENAQVSEVVVSEVQAEEVQEEITLSEKTSEILLVSATKLTQKQKIQKVDGKTVNSMCKEFSKTMELPMDQVLVKYIDGEFSELYADLV